MLATLGVIRYISTLSADNQCAKNVTKFQPLTLPVSSSRGRGAALPVNVITDNDQSRSYKYLVKAIDEPPQMKIVMPGLKESAS